MFTKNQTKVAKFALGAIVYSAAVAIASAQTSTKQTTGSSSDYPTTGSIGAPRVETKAGKVASLAAAAEEVFKGEKAPPTPLPVPPAPMRKGDVNCDGFTDNADIDAFALAIIDLAAWQALHPGCDPSNADVNNDGHVDNGDLDSFARLLTGPIAGDINADGQVNNGDIDAFVILMLDPVTFEKYYPTSSWQRGDLDGDGRITSSDMDSFVKLLLPGE